MFHPTLSKSGRFIFAPLIKFCEYLGNHHPVTLLKIRYWYVFGRKLDLKHPVDINEKILWSKLYSDTSKWVELADKFKVRRYIENLGLADTLVKLYAVWYSADEVDFESLPDTFIIKANNGDGKGTNKIIDKRNLTPEQLDSYKKMIGEWLARKNIGALHAEPHYKFMRPCVIAEEVLPMEDGQTSLTDYKMWCINGKCEYIFVCTNRTSGGNSANVLTYDTAWNPHPEISVFNSDYPQGKPIPRPKNLDKMIAVAEKLSAGFPILRVDLYNVNGKVYFGELTFTSLGGFMDYYKPEFLKTLGSKVDIKDFPLKKGRR